MKRSAVPRYALIIFLLLIIAATTGTDRTHAAEFSFSEQITLGVSGTVWKRAFDLMGMGSINNKVYKFILLKGVLDGLKFGPGDDSVYTPIYYTTYDHLMDALDQFYSDYRNEKILIVWALQIVSMELKGVPKETIDQTLSNFRRVASVASTLK